MTKILFICHGNICRSPMAEFIMKDMVRKMKLDRDFVIASCATSREELGNPVYPPARAELAKHNISCNGKYAVQLKADDYDRYDYLVAMDSMNMRNIFRIIDADPENKIKKLMDYTPRGGDVADPWYTDRFDIAYRDISEGCQALLDEILSKK